MESEIALVVDLALAIGVAFLGGYVAQRLRQPPILGYLVAGVVISPLTPGPVGDLHRLEMVAELGVALLMFALGVEVSLEELRRVARVAVVGGSLQILGTIGVGFGLGLLLGFEAAASLFLGAAAALSSTVVVVKLLQSRGELGAPHGRLALGLLLAQDLAVVPLMVLLPALAAPPGDLLGELLSALLKAAAMLAATLLLGTRVVPWLLVHLASIGSRELFLLAVVAIALGTAVATSAAGLSLAFGAFLAGLIVSESEFAHQVLGEVVPVRDLFATLFFVAVGMLLNPAYLVANAPLILLLAFALMAAKTGLVAMVVLLLRHPLPSALLTALVLGQLGEFSFVLARVGVEQGLIGTELFSLILALALVTIVATPAARALGPPLLHAIARRWPPDPGVAMLADERDWGRHTVILGYGRVGRALADALDQRGLPYLVVELDPQKTRELRKRGVPTLLGDAGSPVVLERCHLERARVLAVTIPDLPAAERAIRYARQVPRQGRGLPLTIVARGHSEAALAMLRRAGADEVVQPELEGGLEFVRCTLQRYGVLGPELQALIAGRRARAYGASEAEQPPW